MRVFSKNKYRFLKPGATLLTAPDPKETQRVEKEIPFTEAFFELEPDKFQEAPAWIQDDYMFKLAVADGDIEIVVANPVVTVTADPEEETTATPKRGRR